MRRILAAAAVALGLAAPVAPLATADAYCYYDLGKVCLPSECMLVASVVRTANNAAGQPLGTNPPPRCID